MLTRSHITLREALTLSLLVFLPLLVMFALASRAANNERAAVQSSMHAELERQATRLGASYQQRLTELDAQLSSAAVGAKPLAELPPFAQWVSASEADLANLSAASSARVATPQQPQQPFAADCTAQAANLAELVKDAARANRFLQHCQRTRTASGRQAWPLVALHPDAAVRPELAVLRSWLQQHAAEQNDVEREANRLELLRASWLTSDSREELAELAAAFPHGQQPWLGLVQSKLRQRPAAARLSWADAHSRGTLVRQADGGYVGYLVHRASLNAALAAGWPSLSGVHARLLDVQSEGPFAFEALPGGASLLLSWADPEELGRRTARSRQLLLAAALAAALVMLLLVSVLGIQLRKQRQLSALRTDFVAAVSHELRTPIASLRMLSELLEADALEPDEVPEARRALVREAARLGDTVDQLLSFSRMQAGKLPNQRELSDVSALVEAALTTFEQRHGIAIQRNIAADLHAEVDSAAIAMVVRNLLENARRHAPNGTPYEVSLKRERDGLVLAVRDHGPGISRSHLRRIFEPFERVDDRLSQATEGSGIGLSLVRHVANAHGGRISVQSEPGQGAEFSLWLPLADATRQDLDEKES